MEGDDLAALAENIRQYGLQTPITLYEGKILDGRNRYRACQLAAVEPRTQLFPADRDPLAFVLSVNLHRRHLTTSQRALLAARIATLPQGGANKKQTLNSGFAFSIAQAAEKLGVGMDIVQKAKTVLQDPVQTRAVESGERSVHAAASAIKAAQAPKAAQVSAKVPRDATNFEVPEALRPLWDRKSEVDAVLVHLSRASGALQAACDARDPLFAPTDLSAALTHLHAACQSVSRSALFAVCDSCDGVDAASCSMCQGRGFLNEEDYARNAPADETSPSPNPAMST